MKHLLRMAAVVLVSVAPLGAGRAHFHMALRSSAPSANDTVRVALTQIRLTFTQHPDPAVSTMSLRATSGDSARVALGAVAPGSDTLSVVAPITGSLASGTYQVAWRSMSRDGHPVSGTFVFTFRPAAAGTSR